MSATAMKSSLEIADAKLICVAGITPTKADEGKTTTAVSLTQGLGTIGRRPVLGLREASLGPVFAIKGGAAGGGYAQVVPMEDMNLHFTGDFHAIGAANNLLAAMLDASILHGNPCDIDQLAVPCVVAVNRRPEDSDAEVELVRRLAVEHGAFAAGVNDAFAHGGPGAADLAHAAVEACEQPNTFDQLYALDIPIKQKIETVAKRVYGASEVTYARAAEDKIKQFTANGLDTLPVCMAKTPLSLSADPALLGAPEDFALEVRDVRAYTGAGWLVPLCGDIMQMPGLGETPAAHRIDLLPDGRIVGLF